MVNTISKPKTLLKYNMVAIIATTVDYGVFLILSEAIHVWYLLASFIGLIAGGLTAFVLQRNWTFKKKDGKLSKQAIRFFFVWTTSIILNTVGLYLAVEYVEIQSIIAKATVSIIVGIGFNFLMNKYFVFK